jgi:hypothetical protein
VIDENVLSAPDTCSLAVLLPPPLAVLARFVPLSGPLVAVTETDWLLVDARLIVAPINTPRVELNCESEVVPKLALAALVDPPPSGSVAVAELEKFTVAVFT